VIHPADGHATQCRGPRILAVDEHRAGPDQRYEMGALTARAPAPLAPYRACLGAAALSRGPSDTPGCSTSRKATLRLG
jgi:hypothetical protein